MSPKLTPEATSLTLLTKFRVEGDTAFRTLSWSSQSFTQARADLHAALGAPDTDPWKAFCAAADEIEAKTSNQPRKQPERQKKKK